MGTIRFSGTAGTAVVSAMLAAASAPAEAVNRQPADPVDGYYAYADVVEVSPRYGWHEVTEPVRECVQLADDYGHYRDDRYRYRDSRYYDYDDHRDRRHREGGGAAGLVGGLIGGLIGHQFGGGDGKTALTIVGAALGASIASGHARREMHEDTYAVRHCTESGRTRRVRGVSGYDVTYRYQGGTFHKWVDEHPGEVIRVHVAVEPLAAD